MASLSGIKLQIRWGWTAGDDVRGASDGRIVNSLPLSRGEKHFGI